MTQYDNNKLTLKEIETLRNFAAAKALNIALEVSHVGTVDRLLERELVRRVDDQCPRFEITSAGEQYLAGCQNDSYEN